MRGGKNTKRFRIFLTIFVIFSLTVNLLGGCGGKSFDKRLELTVWNTQGTDWTLREPAKDNVVEDWLIDKTNVRIKHGYGNGGAQWEIVLARLIAGNNFPDIVTCGGGQGPVHFAKLAEIDKIWELTPQMLQKYAPDIWERVPQDMWERIKIDGKIYGIPYDFPVNSDEKYSEFFSERQRKNVANDKPVSVGTDLWIRDDILKMLYPEAKTWSELNEILKNAEGNPIGDEVYDVPLETEEDIVNLFRRIKELGLEENGNPVYAFGYSSMDCWVPFAQLGAQMEGYVGRNYITTWDTEKQEIILPLLENSVHDTALIQNRLIREGVFDPQSLLISIKQYKEKLLNGEYAVSVISSVMHPPDLNNELEKRGKTFRYRPLYTNVKPISGMGPVETKTTWGSSAGILKTVKEEDLPQVLNWMNIQFTEEWEDVRYWGPKEAGLYIEKEDGTREFKNDELNKKYIRNEFSAITEADRYGLYDNAGIFFMRFVNQSKWEPKQFNNAQINVLVPNSGARFGSDSIYRTEVKEAPMFNVWDAEFANLKTVQDFWSSRTEWEMPFRTTLVAKSDEEFEAAWQAAEENLKHIVDVEKMLSEMTEIAKNSIK